MGNALVFDNARSTLSAMGVEIAARGGFGFGPHDSPHTEAQDLGVSLGPIRVHARNQPKWFYLDLFFSKSVFFKKGLFFDLIL